LRRSRLETGGKVAAPADLPPEAEGWGKLGPRPRRSDPADPLASSNSPSTTDSVPQPTNRAKVTWLRQALRDPEGQVGLALASMASLAVLWGCFGRVPTEVVGRGVLIVPGKAAVIDARAEGQILSIGVKVGIGCGAASP
jgi:hypothetical protein